MNFRKVYSLALVIYSACISGVVLGKDALNVGLLFPFTGSWPIGARIAGGAVVAFENVKTLQLLDQFDISYSFKDSGCDSQKATEKAMELLRNWPKAKAMSNSSESKRLDAYIGPGCSSACEAVALVAGANHIPVVSYSCSAQSLLNKSTYPTFYTAVMPWVTLAPMYNALMNHYGHRKCAVFADMNSELMLSMATAVMEELEGQGKIVYYYPIAPVLKDQDNVIESLENAQTRTRVVVLLLNDDDSIELLLLARKLGMMDGNRIFTGLEILDYDDKRDDKHGTREKALLGFLNAKPAEQIYDSGREEFGLRVFEALFQHDLFEASNTLPSYYEFNQVDIAYAALVHDAVVLYAWAVNQTLKEGFNKDDGPKIAQQMANIDVDTTIRLDLQSGRIHLDETGARIQDYDVFMYGQRDNGEMETLLFRWNPMEQELYQKYDDSDTLGWATVAAQLPKRAPKCGWDNERCQDSEPRNISYLTCTLALSCPILVSLLIYLLHKYTVCQQKRNEIARWQAFLGNLQPDENATEPGSTSSEDSNQETSQSRPRQRRPPFTGGKLANLPPSNISPDLGQSTHQKDN